MKERTYICIDLKSFYASVECIELGLNPLDTHLVVADKSRTEKTICLAVTPSLKALGVPGRPRLFEVVQRIKEQNYMRAKRAPGKMLSGSSQSAKELIGNPSLAIDYIVAPPRMRLYIAYSTRIYNIYLKYVSPEDIHVYSIDEVFMDITDYLYAYKASAKELTIRILKEVYEETGITATAGIGTNLYLAKVAMDIVAKRKPADGNGARIATLTERSYREELWNHTPLTDFWRIGAGYAKKLAKNRLFTMGDIARLSVSAGGEDRLFKLFGVNAELLIDHAWGRESCTMQEIKQYRPEQKSLGAGQVLTEAYTNEKARIILHEMAEQLSLDMVQKHVCADQMVLTVGYDVENLNDPNRAKRYKGEITVDRYGRCVPKHAHGTQNLPFSTASTGQITGAACSLFDRITDKSLLIRRIQLTANRVISEEEAAKQLVYEQLDLFTDAEAKKQEEQNRQKEKAIQVALIQMKGKYGKNAVFRGIDLEEGATALKRNAQIGGHKA